MTTRDWITAEIRRIDKQIEVLQARRTLLTKQKPAQWLLQHALPGEKITLRNLDKIVVLARVIDLLKQTPLPKNGRSTSEISTHLREVVGVTVNDATLRSYLHRFKLERRIGYDDRAKKWSLLPAARKN